MLNIHAPVDKTSSSESKLYSEAVIDAIANDNLPLLKLLLQSPYQEKAREEKLTAVRREVIKSQIKIRYACDLKSMWKVILDQIHHFLINNRILNTYDQMDFIDDFLFEHKDNINLISEHEAEILLLQLGYDLNSSASIETLIEIFERAAKYSKKDYNPQKLYDYLNGIISKDNLSPKEILFKFYRASKIEYDRSSLIKINRASRTINSIYSVIVKKFFTSNEEIAMCAIKTLMNGIISKKELIALHELLNNFIRQKLMQNESAFSLWVPLVKSEVLDLKKESKSSFLDKEKADYLLAIKKEAYISAFESSKDVEALLVKAFAGVREKTKKHDSISQIRNTISSATMMPSAEKKEQKKIIPLHLYPIADMLIKSKFSAHHIDSHGYTLADYALACGASQCLEYLQGHSVNLSSTRQKDKKNAHIKTLTSHKKKPIKSQNKNTLSSFINYKYNNMSSTQKKSLHAEAKNIASLRKKELEHRIKMSPVRPADEENVMFAPAQKATSSISLSDKENFIFMLMQEVKEKNSDKELIKKVVRYIYMHGENPVDKIQAMLEILSPVIQCCHDVNHQKSKESLQYLKMIFNEYEKRLIFLLMKKAVHSYQANYQEIHQTEKAGRKFLSYRLWLLCHGKKHGIDRSEKFIDELRMMLLDRGDKTITSKDMKDKVNNMLKYGKGGTTPSSLKTFISDAIKKNSYLSARFNFGNINAYISTAESESALAHLEAHKRRVLRSASISSKGF